MKLRIVAVGTRLQQWIDAGVEEYARRMPRDLSVEVVEVAASPRRGQPLAKALAEEGDRQLRAIGLGDRVVALDVTGRTLGTDAFAERLEAWRMMGSDVSFLVGGADGLAEICRRRADETVSLSALTFPHGLVRILLAEQLYRAWTILNRHPYHRA